MQSKDSTVLVFGATGQQGGAVALALKAAGWKVRALTRDPESPKARALASTGATLMRGDLADRTSIEAAMAGVYGVFSVQPSSGQGAVYGVSDADEVRYGTTVADVAQAAGVRCFVYSSANAAGDAITGVGHFDSKIAVERHLRTLDMPSIVVRPSAFMEILMLPGLGLAEGCLTFFMRPDQPMQFIAATDIGRIVAAIFAAPERFEGRTVEIAGDALTGYEMAARLSHAAGQPIRYRRFPDAVLTTNLFLRGLADLVDDGRLAGNADIAALRRLVPGLLTFEAWLEGPGRVALANALRADLSSVALR